LTFDLSPDGRRYDRLADGPDEFHGHWAVVRWLLESAAGPLTRQQIERAWPADVARPHEATLWRWLDRAVELGLAVRVGREDEYGAVSVRGRAVTHGSLLRGGSLSRE
jgi:hypothetical protein